MQSVNFLMTEESSREQNNTVYFIDQTVIIFIVRSSSLATWIKEIMETEERSQSISVCLITCEFTVWAIVF